MSGNIPGADKLDVAELCINLKDQKLYSKDADGNVFELGGKVDSGITPPPGPGNSIGDLFWDGDFLLVWNGNEWVPVGAANLDYTPAPDKGTITNTAGDDVDLPLADDTNAGLMSPDEHKKLGDMPAIISGNTFPGTPELGDIWIDTNLCPPSINIWNDCEDPGNPDWTPIGGGEPTGCQQGGVAIAGDTEIGSTLTATGGRGLDAGELLPEPTYNWTGPNGFTATSEEIVANEEGNYTVTATITCLDGSELSTSATKTISDSYVDMVNNTPPIIAVLGELPDGAYEGNSIYVVTPATVINGENPVIVENQWFKDDAADGTGQLYVIGAGDEGKAITCKQLFRDARTNELLSEASNAITIVARPADAITFTSVITDDGTPNANTPGHVLTASAENIVGGVAPIEYEYKWLVEGLTMGANKTLNIISTFVGKIVSCEVTVAEPDGTNPEVRTAVYSKVIEIAGTINTPSVLGPQDGAGSGDMRYLLSDTIIDVEGGDIITCETDAIESVDVRQGFEYKYYGIPGENGPTLAVKLSQIPSISTATYFADVNFGERPEGYGNVHYSFYELSEPGIVSVIRPGGNANKDASLAWSDDGTNWLGAIFFQPGGVGPDRPITGTEPHKYWCYWFLNTSHGSSIYMPDNEYMTVKLTFPTSNSFGCFEPGDVVQSVEGGGWTGTFQATYLGENAFDGNYSVYTNSVAVPDKPAVDFATVTCEWNGFIAVPNGSTVKCVYWQQALDGGDLIVNNQKLDVTQVNNTTLYELDITAQAGSAITQLKINRERISSGAIGFAAILIDGVPVTGSEYTDGDRSVKIISKDEDANTITVDGGEWVNDSQVWSDGADKSYLSYPITNGFDGSETTIAYAQANDPITITFDPAITIRSSLDIWANHSGSNNNHLIINGTPVANVLTSTNSSIVKDTFGQFSELSTLEIGSTGADFVGFSKVAIDGCILIDQGLDVGSSKLVKETPYDTKLTVASVN